MFKRLCLLFLIVAFVMGRYSATENRAASKAERIDELVAHHAKYGYLNGAVLVAEHGKIIYEKGIGEANMESHLPNTPRTKFGIASLTKQFTAVLAPGEPGAGSTMEEMRGDMPGNYFSWILRYPEQDGEIIVLRNVYGSTERLEQNIQAILYDMEPRMPSRSPKDMAARLWQVPGAWAESHRALSVVVVLFAVAVIWQVARRRRKTGA